MLEDAIRRAFRDRSRVKVQGSDFKYEGTLQAVFHKRSGVLRVVVEDDNRVLHVAYPREIELALQLSAKHEIPLVCPLCGGKLLQHYDGYDMANDKKFVKTLCLECRHVFETHPALEEVK